MVSLGGCLKVVLRKFNRLLAPKTVISASPVGYWDFSTFKAGSSQGW